MSDARSGARTIVDADDGLLARFKNARDALPERAVAKPDSERFHRGEAEKRRSRSGVSTCPFGRLARRRCRRGPSRRSHPMPYVLEDGPRVPRGRPELASRVPRSRRDAGADGVAERRPVSSRPRQSRSAAALLANRRGNDRRGSEVPRPSWRRDALRADWSPGRRPLRCRESLRTVPRLLHRRRG